MHHPIATKLQTLLFLSLFGLVTSAVAQDVGPTGVKHLLKYQWKPSEKVRWEVVHRVSFDMTVSGTTKRASTYSKSVKVWDVLKVSDAGEFVIANSVDSVHMWRDMTGRARQEVRLPTQEEIPAGFENVAVSLGKTLSEMRFSSQGKLLKRVAKFQNPAQVQSQEGQHVTLPLPGEPIAVGHVWTIPNEFQLKLEGGATKPIKARDRFELAGVAGGVATILFENQILTPIRDPALESQLIQHTGSGRIKFDINRGRVISTQIDIDKTIVGVRGKASTLHYTSRYTERLLSAAAMTAKQDKPAEKSPKENEAKPEGDADGS